jgi:hypothetical protein
MTPRVSGGKGALLSSESDGPPGEAGGAAHGYFLAIEDFFVRLRGAPLLLAPADWQVARRWHAQGVPLDLVRRAIEEVFARRRERGTRGHISSLRYCAPAVEAAWAERAELVAPGRRHAVAAFDAAGRLRRLAATLPADLVGVAVLRQRLTELTTLAEPTGPGQRRSPAGGFGGHAWQAGKRPGGPDSPAAEERLGDLDPLAPAEGFASLDPQAVEERLADLDREVLDGALAALPGAARAALDAKVTRAVAALAGRLPAPEIERARERLARQLLRERLGLPILSLFSLEAQADEPADGDDGEGAGGEAGTAGEPDA